MRHRQPQHLFDRCRYSRGTDRNPRIPVTAGVGDSLSQQGRDTCNRFHGVTRRTRLRPLPHLHRGIRPGHLVHPVPVFAGVDLCHRRALVGFDVAHEAGSRSKELNRVLLPSTPPAAVAIRPRTTAIPCGQENIPAIPDFSRSPRRAPRPPEPNQYLRRCTPTHH